jgi:hypothetical protein
MFSTSEDPFPPAERPAPRGGDRRPSPAPRPTGAAAVDELVADIRQNAARIRGLSISHDIVVQGHGGTLEFTSAEGEYAEFVVTLPKRPERPREGSP